MKDCYLIIIVIEYTDGTETIEFLKELISKKVLQNLLDFIINVGQFVSNLAEKPCLLRNVLKK